LGAPSVLVFPALGFAPLWGALDGPSFFFFGASATRVASAVALPAAALAFLAAASLFDHFFAARESIGGSSGNASARFCPAADVPEAKEVAMLRAWATWV
jgi:hypothetical protein